MAARPAIGFPNGRSAPRRASRWRSRIPTVRSASAAWIEAVAEGPGGPVARVLLTADDKSEAHVDLPIRAWARRRLALTDDLIRVALRREKAALKEALSPGRRSPAPHPRSLPNLTRIRTGKPRPAARPMSLARATVKETTTAVSANRLELLQIVDAVAREKSIDRSIVLASMEDAMQKAARSRYGQETEVRAEINPRTGEIRFSACCWSSTSSTTMLRHQTLADAQKKEPFGPDRRLDRRIAAAVRLRTHSRAGLQAGAGAENPRGRARQTVRCLQGPGSATSSMALKRCRYGNVVVDLGGSGAW